MADTVENAAFWLPTHFLTDDDLLSDDHLLSLNNKPPIRTHQPHPFSSLHSPVTDRDNDLTKPDANDEDDDDELLAELTRYLTRSSLNHTEKGWGYSTSPQSTLTGFGPWSSNRSGFASNGSPTGPSRIPSPPLATNLKNDAAWELLYEAAAHVARLKLNSLSSHHTTTTTTLDLPPHHLSSLYSHPKVRQGSSVLKQGRGERADCYCPHHHNYHRVHRSYGGDVSSWGPQRGRQQNEQVYTQRRTQEMTAVVLGGSRSGGVGVKKQSSGTGVFIPRRADSGTHHNQPEISTTRKKSSGCSTVLLPAKVVQALNLNVDEMKNGAVNYNNTPKRVLTDHEIMMARRSALMSMQRRNGKGEGATARATMVGHHEIGLPTDWTY